MSLSRITVTAVRNLHPVTLSPSSRINILHGANGSGKTSVLEAIHLLGLARSFRSTRLQPVIHYEQPACTVFGQVQLAEGGSSNLGISRDRQGELQIRIDGQNARSAAQLADLLPLRSTLTASVCSKEHRRSAGSFSIGVCSTWNNASWGPGSACRKPCGSGTHGCAMVHLMVLRRPRGTANCAVRVRRSTPIGEPIFRL